MPCLIHCAALILLTNGSYSNMKSLQFLGLGVLFTANTAFAQTNTYPFPASGPVGVGTSSPLSQLNVEQDNSSNWDGGQLIISGLADRNKRLSLGFDTSNNFGFIQALIAGNNYFPLVLQPHTGNVGIGTANPGTKLETGGSFRSTNNSPLPTFGTGIEVFFQPSPELGVIQTVDRSTSTHKDLRIGPSSFFLANGNVGIGTNSPQRKLELTSDVSGISFETGAESPYASALRFGDNTGWKFHIGRSRNSVNGPLNSGPVGSLVTFQDDGNVGIGTTNPTHKLAVNGTIKAKEVIVETSGWSDYVFDDDYTLQPLAQVEAHIKVHKHLPGIPSAATVATNGVNVGDMQAALLAKVEELTLHLIAQEKELVRLRETEKKIAALETGLQQLQQNR